MTFDAYRIIVLCRCDAFTDICALIVHCLECIHSALNALHCTCHYSAFLVVTFRCICIPFMALHADLCAFSRRVGLLHVPCIRVHLPAAMH